MSNKRYITEYPSPHQAEMLRLWTLDDIGSHCAGNAVTFNNGATVRIVDGRGATDLAFTLIDRARKSYTSSLVAVKTSSDKNTRASARREIRKIEKWIRQSSILALISDANTVLTQFRSSDYGITDLKSERDKK